jgi:formylglycine-generating enzyme required for sulfatase activity
MKSTFLTFCMFASFLSGILANNVTLSNISLRDQYYPNHNCNIMFDISWDNSWRTSTTVPVNWDACWMFAKYRVTGGVWHHCTLSTDNGDYTSPAGCTITPSPDGKGVFIYRSQDGSGNNNWTQVMLRWKYGLDGINDDAEVEVKLFAIEMVYVPQGNFYIGDGNGTDESNFAFHGNTDNLAVQINENLIQNIKVDPWADYDDGTIKSGIGIDGDGGIDMDNNGTIDNPFYPTGYTAFYIMKYETSQEQYSEFLNTLTRTQQQSRIASDISGTSPSAYYVMINLNDPVSGNVIRCASTIPAAPQPVSFFCDFNNNGTPETCDGQTLVCNLLNWSDVCAYADWAGLRPMTELEFEKATRGPNTAIYGEYAWGNTNISLQGAEQGNYGCPDSYIVLDPDEHTGRAMSYEISYNIAGLRRCGEFASSSVNHTRQEAGAGYYGEMEMSGSLSEPAVSLGNVAGRSFRAINGNGELNLAGFADVDYWPGINGNSEPWTVSGPYGGTLGVTDAAGSGFRGGHLAMYAAYLNISFRNFASMGYPNIRGDAHGCRFVRSAF